MVEKMLANRIQRVYADYLKNSPFGLCSLILSMSSHECTDMPDHWLRCGGRRASKRWRWQQLEWLWGLSEHGGKHPLNHWPGSHTQEVWPSKRHGLVGLMVLIQLSGVTDHDNRTQPLPINY